MTKDLQLPVSVLGTIVIYHFTHDLLQTGVAFILLMAGLEMQRFFTPDVDISENSSYIYGFYGFFMIKRDFGIIPHKIIRMWWWPYAKLVPHRNWASHGLIIGTVVRLIYFFIPIWVIIWVILLMSSGIPLERIEWHLVAIYLPYLMYFTLGWFLADLGHLALDKIPLFRDWYESKLGPEYQWHQYHHK